MPDQITELIERCFKDIKSSNELLLKALKDENQMLRNELHAILTQQKESTQHMVTLEQTQENLLKEVKNENQFLRDELNVISKQQKKSTRHMELMKSKLDFEFEIIKQTQEKSQSIQVEEAEKLRIEISSHLDDSVSKYVEKYFHTLEPNIIMHVNPERSNVTQNLPSLGTTDAHEDGTKVTEDIPIVTWTEDEENEDPYSADAQTVESEVCPAKDLQATTSVSENRTWAQIAAGFTFEETVINTTSESSYRNRRVSSGDGLTTAVKQITTQGYSDDTSEKIPASTQAQPARKTLSTADLIGVAREENLARKYQQQCLWMTPLPFNQEPRFNLKEFYVEPNLKIIGPQLLGNEEIKMEELFEPVVNVSLPIQRVLLLGDIGSGKSSLCMYWALEWSLRATTFISLPRNTTLLILFELRNLKTGANLEYELMNFVKPYLSQMLASANTDVVHYLSSLQRNVLILLDGFDELASEMQNEVRHFLSLKENSSPFSGSTIPVTSRPNVASPELLGMFDKIVTITSFSEEKLEWFLSILNEHYHSSGASEKKVKRPRTVSYRDTQFAEQKVLEKTNKTLELSTMSPLMISLLYWIINSPEFINAEVIYNCVVFLCERSSNREGFGFTTQEIRHLLWTYGFLNVHTKQSDLSEELLRKSLGLGFSLFPLSGIIRKSAESTTEKTLWEPTQKVFLQSLIDSVVDNTNEEYRYIELYQLENVLERDFKSRFYSSKVRNHCFRDKTYSSYLTISSADGKLLFCRWNEKTQRMSFSTEEYSNPGTVEIELSFWACSWTAIESIYQKIAPNDCARQYFTLLRTLNLRKYTHWRSYSIMLSYEELTKECIGDLVCPEGENLMSKLGRQEKFKELRLHVKNSSCYQNIIYILTPNGYMKFV